MKSILNFSKKRRRRELDLMIKPINNISSIMRAEDGMKSFPIPKRESLTHTKKNY